MLIPTAQRQLVWGPANPAALYTNSYDPDGVSPSTPGLGLVDVRGYEYVQFVVYTDTPASSGLLQLRVASNRTPVAQASLEGSGWNLYTSDDGTGTLTPMTWVPDAGLASFGVRVRCFGSVMRAQVLETMSTSQIVSVYAFLDRGDCPLAVTSIIPA